MQKRFMLYSHDGLGLGHVSRNVAISAALTRGSPGSAVLLVTGCREVDGLGLPGGVDVLRLPSLRKVANGRYSARRLPVTGSRLRDLRAAQVAAAVEAFEPDVLLVDRHPLGIREELLPALGVLEAAGGTAVLGLRDVLDEPATVRREWVEGNWTETVRRHYELILVYGTRRMLDHVKAYGFPPPVAERIRYTGHVVHPSPDPVAPADGLPRRGEATDAPVVLATAGGGADGERLCKSFLLAAAGAGWTGVVVTGPELAGAGTGRLTRLASEHGVELRSFTPNLGAWIASADALVCMGGYNTLCEAVRCGVPTVCVPRVEPRAEQLIRANRFAEAYPIEVVPPERLGPSSLAAAIGTALSYPTSSSPRNGIVDLGGADRAARALLRLAGRVGERRPAATARSRG